LATVKRPRLLLFDIDGTLMQAGGTGRRAFEAVLAQHGALPKVLAELRFAGMTDRAIMRSALELSGLPADAATVSTLLSEYVNELRAELDAGGRQECRACPGARELLIRLQARAEIALGLGTGNVQPGALLKLRAVGLERFFTFGGFGSDHDDRAEVLRIGVTRGTRALGDHLNGARVIVIGDTPRDVAAARAIGAECLAVATGPFDVHTLSDAGATWVVPTLTEPRALQVLVDDEI
jgi:phosphoglycolate phosphatase